MSARRTFSGGSDRRQLEAQRAYERLALERAEYEENRKNCERAWSSVKTGDNTGPLERKDWFGRWDTDGRILSAKKISLSPDHTIV